MSAAAVLLALLASPAAALNAAQDTALDVAQDAAMDAALDAELDRKDEAALAQARHHHTAQPNISPSSTVVIHTH
ncbi:hypothetical protein RR48_04228 [Papilio machaon]|uniref:Secreted protein n=1 Tax=Papilio machaon TaxID=76193 RepID=A0A0N1I652_PAPMA|nr:hypothetical protein RR48_04228 [Papilio machaon]